MACRQVLPIVAVAALLAATGCSKTQDTAPDPMRFGQPPVIESVNAGAIPLTTERELTCDFTRPFGAFLFDNSEKEDYCDLDDRHTTGTHVPYPKRKTRILAYWRLADGVELRIGGTYTETHFEALVTDPDSDATGDNVRLVTASFVRDAGTTGATETSLVVLDDGSTNVFKSKQKTSSLPLGTCIDDVITEPAVTTCRDVLVFDPETGEPLCPPPDPQFADSHFADCLDPMRPTEDTCTPCSPDGAPCSGTNTVCLYCETTPETTTIIPKCQEAEYDLNTNDMVQGDHIFTRGFAFFNLRFSFLAETLMQDCIASAAHQAPFPLAGVQTVEFTLEAVDKQGNLAEWGQKLLAPINTNQFICTGDDCLCCFIHHGTFGGPCEDMPGLVDPVNDPSGRCDTEDNPKAAPPPSFIDRDGGCNY